MSDVIRRDPEVAALVAAESGELVAEPFEAQLKGFDEQEFPLWRLTRSALSGAKVISPVPPVLGTAPFVERP